MLCVCECVCVLTVCLAKEIELSVSHFCMLTSLCNFVKGPTLQTCVSKEWQLWRMYMSDMWNQSMLVGPGVRGGGRR